MTTQFSDLLIFRGTKFVILEVTDAAGWRGVQLVHPEDFGMKGRMTSTANRKGFSALCEVSADSLRLRGFGLCEFSGAYKPIGGVAPLVERSDVAHEADAAVYGHYGSYHDLDVPVAFTGTVRIAAGNNDAPDAPRLAIPGAKRPFPFAQAFDLVFREGQLVSTVDLLVPAQ
jgi:hypothetical protein